MTNDRTSLKYIYKIVNCSVVSYFYSDLKLRCENSRRVDSASTRARAATPTSQSRRRTPPHQSVGSLDRHPIVCHRVALVDEYCQMTNQDWYSHAQLSSHRWYTQWCSPAFVLVCRGVTEDTACIIQQSLHHQILRFVDPYG